ARETHLEPLCPADHIEPPPDTKIKRLTSCAYRLPLVSHHVEVQGRQSVSYLTLQHFVYPGEQRWQPARFRSRKANFIPTIENGIRHETAHGTSKHGFTRAVCRNNVFLG